MCKQVNKTIDHNVVLHAIDNKSCYITIDINEPDEENDDSDDKFITNPSVFPCDYCNKKFNNKYYLNRHLKRCKDKIKVELSYTIEQLNTEMRELKETTINVTNTINNIENLNINISADQYRRSYMDTVYPLLTARDIKEALKTNNMVLGYTVPKTHFNKDIPENQNLYLNNLSSSYALLLENNAWRAYTWEWVFDRLMFDNERILTDWIEIHGEQYPDLSAKLDRFLTRCHENNKHVTELKRNLKSVLWNNRKVVFSNDTIQALCDGDNSDKKDIIKEAIT
tara:strand:- start:241 stop:1086 length:846 start_codon:yes stop_codon:yes gene_type:complete